MSSTADECFLLLNKGSCELALKNPSAARESFLAAAATKDPAGQYSAWKRYGRTCFDDSLWEEAKRGFENAINALDDAPGEKEAIDAESELKTCRTWVRKCNAEIADAAEELASKELAGAPEAAKEGQGDKKQSADRVVDAQKPSAVAGKKLRPTQLMPKYQYYQSDKVVTISILEPNVKSEDLKVDFALDTLKVTLKKQGHDLIPINGRLFDGVEVDKCKVLIKNDKVNIKLRKRANHNWHDLFGAGAQDVRATEDDEFKGLTSEEKKLKEEEKRKALEDNNFMGEKMTVKDADGKKRPYASTRDWDAIERDLKKKEEEDKGEGEEALNSLFKQIYGNADEDTRRAMIKSFQTSGGTSLSTNWKDVEKTDYEKQREAPKGMVWKNWEGDKLPQKEDN